MPRYKHPTGYWIGALSPEVVGSSLDNGEAGSSRTAGSLG